MASATLPPWLEATPQLYAGVAEAGLREGVQEGAEKQRALEFGQEMALKQQEFQANTALTAQKLQQEQLNTKMTLAKFLSDQKQQELDNQLRMEKFQSDKNIAEQSLAVDKAYKEQTIQYHQGQAATQNQRYQMQADVAARKFQAQQEAMRRIHNGESVPKVLLDLGGALGESASGLAALLKQTEPEQPRPDVSEGPPMVTRNGRTYYGNYDDKGNLRWTEARGQGGEMDDKYIGHLQNAIKLLQTNPLSNNAGTPEHAKLMQYMEALDRALKIGGEGDFGIRGVVGRQPPAFTEEGDRAVDTAPSHEEEGETTAPAWQPPGLMQFPQQPYRVPLGIP